MSRRSAASCRGALHALSVHDTEPGRELATVVEVPRVTDADDIDVRVIPRIGFRADLVSHLSSVHAVDHVFDGVIPEESCGRTDPCQNFFP